MVNDDLLELRVHGVNNTPPTSLLYAIQEEYGDSLVGVYGERSNTGLVRALSWGGLARMSPIPRIPFVGWLQSVGSAAWILVVPFGLANVAYWSRRLIMPGEKYRGARVTAALARVFSLGLTLLLASSVCSVSLDMAEGRVVSKDPPLPSWLRWLGDLEPGCRLAMLSAAPLLAMLLLFVLARWSRVRYDRGNQVPESATNQPRAPGTAQPDVWKFGSRDFWDNADLSTHNSAVHTAAGVALSSIWTGQIWFTEHHRAGVAVVVVSVAIVAVCVGLIAGMPLVTEGKPIGTKRKALAWLMLLASLALFAVQFFALLFGYSPTQEPRPLAGLSFVPGALVFILLVLAVSALGWRWFRRMSYVVAAVPLLLGAVVLAVHQCKLVGADQLVFVDSLLAAVLAVLAVGWLVWLYRPNARRTEDAWHGTAPGVLMVLALFAAALFSTVFVMVAATLLGDGNIRINDTELMTAPPVYLSFASMLFPVFIALMLLIIVFGCTMLFCRNPIEPALDLTTGPDDAQMCRLTRIFDATNHAPRWAKLFRLRRPWNLVPTRRRKRRLAAAAHRAEPIGAVLAAVAALGICGGLILSLMLHNGLVAKDASPLPLARTLGVALAGVIGSAIVSLGTTRRRPLGIVWDLICFLPRAAHPFGPPCYAQRAVPELLNYCRAWLDTPSKGENPPRKLILSAHSLGGVLAVAIVLLLADKYRTRIALVTYGCQLRAYFARIFPELLGPRILGVTTSRPARLSRCPTFDDGASAVPDGGDDPASVRETLTEAGGVRWINLWRPTDYLGFPVYSRAPDNPLDRPADEVTAEASADGKIATKPKPAGEAAAEEPAEGQTPQQTSEDIHKWDAPAPMTTSARFEPTETVRVDTHSDYFRARQYPDAIKDLRQRLGATPLT